MEKKDDLCYRVLPRPLLILSMASLSNNSAYKPSWVDIIMCNFARPPKPDLEEAKRPVGQVWDEEKMPWTNIHAFLTKEHLSKEKETEDEAKEIVNKPATKSKSAAAKEDYLEDGWDKRDACCVDELWDGLFLGNMKSAGDEIFMNKNKIHAVLNVTPQIPFFFGQYRNERIGIDDSADAPWESHLIEAMRFLDRCYVSNTNVLVHCRMGQSRSVSYVLAWGMLRFKYPLLKLEKKLEEKRYGGIRLNVGFRTKLGMIAERLGMVNMTNRSNSIMKRKRYSEEHGYNPHARVYAPRARFLPYNLIGKKLCAKAYVGFEYRIAAKNTYGKMGMNGMVVGKNGREYIPSAWEANIALSKAKKFNDYAYIVDVDGVKLDEQIGMRDFRVQNNWFTGEDDGPSKVPKRTVGQIVIA